MAAKPRSPSVTGKPWRPVVLAILLPVLLHASQFSAEPTQGPPPQRLADDRVKVPDVIGRTAKEAERILRESSLRVGGQVRRPADKPPETVLAQSPAAGTLVPRDTSVELVVSTVSPSPPVALPPSPAPANPTAPPTRSGSPPRAEPSRTETVDEVLTRLEVANIAFNAPKSLRLHESTEIHLLLSMKESIEQLQSRITAAGEKEGAKVRISNQVSARLEGPGFTITKVTEDLQAVSRTERTEWKWEVTAMKQGLLRLHLTLSIPVQINDKEIPRTIETFSRTIEVDVTWPEWTRAFIANNFHWAWGAILVPLAGWLIRKWRRRRSG